MHRILYIYTCRLQITTFRLHKDLNMSSSFTKSVVVYWIWFYRTQTSIILAKPSSKKSYSLPTIIVSEMLFTLLKATLPFCMSILGFWLLSSISGSVSSRCETSPSSKFYSCLDYSYQTRFQTHHIHNNCIGFCISIHAVYR